MFLKAKIDEIAVFILSLRILIQDTEISVAFLYQPKKLFKLFYAIMLNLLIKLT